MEPVKFLIVMPTYNRLAYTKKTIKSLRDTISVPYELVLVDNASTDGTKKWVLNTKGAHKFFNDENKYPGAACNLGFNMLLDNQKGFTHLMRLDNDMKLEQGWDMVALRAFKAFPTLGQLGLDYGPIRTSNGASTRSPWLMQGENMRLSSWPGNIGGTMILKKELWDKGLRYDETPWPEAENPQIQEDWKMSQAVKAMGYDFGHLLNEYANTIDKIEDYPEYFAKTYKERNYDLPVTPDVPQA